MISKKAKVLEFAKENSIGFHETLNDDIPYLWAAYKQGSFCELGEVFKLTGMNPEEFKDALHKFLFDNNLEIVTFFHKHDGDIKPVGVVLTWSRGRVIQIFDIVWFSWASNRMIFESLLIYFSIIPKLTHEPSNRKYKVLEFAQYSKRKIFEKLVDCDALRKVGHVNDLYEAEKAVLFESKEA